MSSFNLGHWIDPLKKIFKNNKLEQRKNELLTQLSLNPNDARIKIQLAELYFRLRKIEEGIQLFKEVVTHYEAEEFWLKSIAIYKNILKVAPARVEFNERLSDLYHKLGMSKDAINQCLIQINYYQNKGEKEKTLASAQHMVSIDPEDINNRIKLAEIYFNQGLEKEAYEEYETISLKLKNQDGKQLGLLIDILEKLHFRRPKENNLLKEICYLYLKIGDPVTVMKKIEKAKLETHEEFKDLYLEAKHLKENPPVVLN